MANEKRPARQIVCSLGEQMKEPPAPMKDARGGRQYHLPRVSTTQLAAGMRTLLSEFETATKGLVQADFDFRSNAIDEDDFLMVKNAHDRRKQAILRKLIRIQNGTEVIDVEALKHDTRKLARFIRAIILAPEQAASIIKTSPEVATLVAQVIEGRRHRAHHVLLDRPRHSTVNTSHG